MTTSGTSTFTITRDEIIDEALIGLSVIEEGETASAATVTKLTRTLNLLLKNLQTDGIMLWTIADITIPLVASQTSYTVGPSGCNVTTHKPMRLVEAYIRDTSATPDIDAPLEILSKQEYLQLGSKSATGKPSSVYLDVGNTSSALYTYVTPDTTTATDYEIHIVAKRQIQDVGTAGATFDLPVEWMLPLKWMLMAEVAVDYDKTLQDRAYYDTKAAVYKDSITSWDVEYASTYFIPESR